MTFQTGTSGNPKGRPPGVFHNYSTVADQILDAYSVTDILALAEDHEECKKRGLKPFEVMVMQKLANIFNRADKAFGSAERERLLDRTIGKATQQVNIEHSGGVAVISAGIQDIKSWLREANGGEIKDSNEVVREERSLLPAPLHPEKTVL